MPAEQPTPKPRPAKAAASGEPTVLLRTQPGSGTAQPARREARDAPPPAVAAARRLPLGGSNSKPSASLALALGLRGSILEPPAGGDGALECSEAIEAVGFGPFQLVLVLLCGLIYMADGMEMMLVSFISPAVRCEFGISDVEVTLLTTVVFAGLMFGSLGE